MSADVLENTQEILSRLIAFDTVTHRSNLAIIAYIEGLFAQAGVATLRAPNATGDKAALLAMIGPKQDGGVVLSGHTDVVPVTGQSWSADPFRLRRQEDRLVGRGACDMKGFLAAALAAIPMFQAAKLKRPVLFAFSYDEETTCLGSLDLIARFGLDWPRPALAVVGEPTMMRVADAHKGVATFTTRVFGHAAHSSRPALGADAVGVACDIGAEIGRLGRACETARLDARFDPPHSTYHVGIVRGGEARNVLASECVIEWEFRSLPGDDVGAAAAQVAAFIADVARPRLRRWRSDVDIVTHMDADVPALQSSGPDAAGLRLAMHIVGQNQPDTAPFASEAGHFQRAGIDTVLCGPGSIAQAHQPDEYVTLDQLAKANGFFERLAIELSQS
jgi:acetylornithine deacetylase